MDVDGNKAKPIGDGLLEKILLVACGATWLVVDKPSGMSIHNDPGGDLCSLALAAHQAGHLPELDPRVTALHAVHRLDRDTSGIVLLAGSSQTQAFLSKQFADRKVHKEYLAVVHGGDLGESTDLFKEGVWDWSLTAAAAGRKDPMGKGKRVPCSTRWQVLARSPHYSLIQCMPASGRKHQIRRHAKLAGHPVVGDRRYGSMRALNYLKEHYRFDRLALHAHRLSIRLPESDRPTVFSSQGLPHEIERLLVLDKEGVQGSPKISQTI